MQRRRSNLPASYRLWSMAMNATKAVICKMKLKKIATVAYSANVLTAGISVTEPMAKQAPSDIDVIKIDGPTWPNASAMLSLTPPYCVLSKRLYVCTKMNKLSTPTANTKNGITSIVNIVVAKPTYPKIPKLHATDETTTTIPPSARTIFEWTWTICVFWLNRQLHKLRG